jgi:hypothetical protein
MMLSMASGGGGVRLHHLGELVVFGDDPVHAHLGGELDLFGRLLVRRVGRGDDQAVVALGQHDHPVAPGRSWRRAGLGQALRSMASRSSSGAPKADDMVWARSAADTAPEPVSSAMKLVRLV